MVITLSVMADAMAIAAVLDGSHAFRMSGASTIVLNAEGQVSGQACDALSLLPGVTASGAVRKRGHKLRTANLPSQEIDFYDGTQGMVRLLGVETDSRVDDSSNGSHLLLETNLADRVGVVPGDEFRTDQGQAWLAGEYDYPDDGRLQVLSNAAVMIRATTGWYDQCWAQFWPVNVNARTIVSRVVYRQDSDQKVIITQLNPSYGITYDGASWFLTRPTRYAALAAWGLCFGFAFLVVRQRRTEFALSRHVGVAKSALVIQVAVETLWWVIPLVSVAVPALWLVERVLLPDSEEILVAGARIAAAGLLGAFAASVLVAATSTQQKLFRLLKER
ncbi:hypothetical protein BH09ACT6_BH09ACT6_22540 [soil metagenome]